ncbi:hypothetical protein Tco_1258553 [Tanacetum coccineum]
MHDSRTDRRYIRLEIDVVRGQRTAYEIELHERAEDDAVRQMMCTHILEARAQIDMVEDIGSSSMIHRAIQRNSTHTQDDASHNSGGGLRRPVQPARGTLKKKLMDKYCPKGEIKKLEIELWNLMVRGNDVTAYT